MTLNTNRLLEEYEITKWEHIDGSPTQYILNGCRLLRVDPKDSYVVIDTHQRTSPWLLVERNTKDIDQLIAALFVIRSELEENHDTC